MDCRIYSADVDGGEWLLRLAGREGTVSATPPACAGCSNAKAEKTGEGTLICGAGMNLDGSRADERRQQSAGARLPRHIPFIDRQQAMGCGAGAPKEIQVSSGEAGAKQSAMIRVRINIRIPRFVHTQDNTRGSRAQTRTLPPSAKPG